MPAADDAVPADDAAFAGGQDLSDEVADCVLVLLDKAINVVCYTARIMHDYELLSAEPLWLLETLHVGQLRVDRLQQIGVGASGLQHKLLVQKLEDRRCTGLLNHVDRVLVVFKRN